MITAMTSMSHFLYHYHTACPAFQIFHPICTKLGLDVMATFLGPLFPLVTSILHGLYRLINITYGVER